jgi:hypothetical protein
MPNLNLLLKELIESREILDGENPLRLFVYAKKIRENRLTVKVRYTSPICLTN